MTRNMRIQVFRSRSRVLWRVSLFSVTMWFSLVISAVFPISSSLSSLFSNQPPFPSPLFFLSRFLSVSPFFVMLAPSPQPLFFPPVFFFPISFSPVTLVFYHESVASRPGWTHYQNESPQLVMWFHYWRRSGGRCNVRGESQGFRKLSSNNGVLFQTWK